MENPSTPLIESMKYFIPHSLVQHQIRFITSPRLPARNIETLAEAMEALPRLLLSAQLPSGKRQDPHLLPLRRCSVALCEIAQDKPLGFSFPSWRVGMFAVTVEPAWLKSEGKALYDFCLANGLTPEFGKLYNTRGVLGCGLILHWPASLFDQILNLQNHPLFGHYWKVDGPSAPAPEDELVFNEEMDTECVRAAFPFHQQAQTKIAEALAAGKRSALIFTSKIETDVATSDAIDTKWPGFGTSLRARLEGGWVSYYYDRQLFDQPLCYDSVVARGLCIWAENQKLPFDIQMSQPSPDSLQLQLRICFSA